MTPKGPEKACRRKGRNKGSTVIFNEKENMTMAVNNLERKIDDAAYYAERRRKRKRRNTIFRAGLIGLAVFSVALIIFVYSIVNLYSERLHNGVCRPRPIAAAAVDFL